MSKSRIVSGVVGLLLCFAFLLCGSVLCDSADAQQRSKYDQNEEYKRRIRAAERSVNLGAWLCRGAFILVSAGLLYGAWQTHRDGIALTPHRRLQGTAASAIAGGMVLLAVAAIIFGVWYLPSILPGATPEFPNKDRRASLMNSPSSAPWPAEASASSSRSAPA